MPTIQPQVEFHFNPRFLVPLLSDGQNQPMANVVWNEIDAALTRLRKTQEWLAGELGLSNNAVTKWKQSGQISRANAERVSELLGIPLDRLLLGKGNAVVEVLEALPPDRSRAIINQIMYQIEHAEDVLTGDQINHYVSAMAKLVKDMEKKKPEPAAQAAGVLKPPKVPPPVATASDISQEPEPSRRRVPAMSRKKYKPKAKK